MANGKGRYTPEDSTQSEINNILTSQQEAALNALIKSLQKALKSLKGEAIQEYEELYDSIFDLEDQLEEKRIDIFKETSEIQKKAIKITKQFEDELFKNSTVQQRAAIHQYQIDRIKAFQEQYERQQQNALNLAAEQKTLEAKLSAASSEEEKQLFQKKLDNIEKLRQKNQQYLEEHRKSYGESGGDLKAATTSKAKEAMTSGDSSLQLEAAKELRKLAKEEAKGSKEEKQLRKAATNLENKARSQKAKDRTDEIKQKNKDRIAELKYRLTTLDGIKETIGNATAAMVNGLSKMFDNLEQPINSFYEYQAKYEARLQGSKDEYDKMLGNISKQIGLSPFIKQGKMVENLQKAIDSGIDYNIELRAYLATVSEGIASTFDAFDANLLRLIRIQQNDSTAARLGIEAALTKFFNNMYSDTGYLNDVSNNVTAALLDASAQLTHQGAAEMEFVAQKWLGSLYSLGVSGEAVQNIAQGLGYLGSGNVEALSGNENLMSLLSMSATRGGTSISDILTGGLTASRTDMLLQGMVEYLAEIANNTDSNNVTRSSIAQVFGLTNTDLRSISNLTKNDIDKIAETNINYGGALAETATQLTQISRRTHISQMISNIVDNAVTGSALKLGSNAGTYGLYKALNIISGLVGDRGLEIPGIQAIGTGTASGIDILSIAKAAIAGGSLLSSLIDSIGNIGSGGLPSLSSWKGYEKALERGTGLKLQPAGVQSGFSQSAQYNSRGSGSTDDLGASSMQSAKESAQENQSEEDRETADKAEKFYEEGLEHLAKMREIIEDLATSNNSYKLNVSLDTSDNKPLPVVIAPASDDNSTSMAMKITDITDNASTKLNTALRAIIMSAFTDEATNMETGDIKSSLVSQIASALSGVNVHIDNDWFDEAIQNNALGGRG